ncbi:MAG TPA: hypothetical protein DCG19_09075 [Cryomorphaceae bacterium]|nr:hypothetical protein [Owenweeksia sp.]MBF98143.1 hypothetical protein [Owenweeksia sp.]HAD97546.1 hypothetical protein [Cryomorphaceae bacterium]HBF20254.1 hypothetical protein [Cryomorphaceae bacterium]|tara:strand:+ start:853 stop:2118 length:1266 start_codon:yes stop_codon:yes gene_type:complete
MKKWFLLLVLFSTLSCFSQRGDTLTLDQCVEWARSNFPLLKKQQLQSRELDLKLKNISADYLPKLMVNGQLTYQSDVPEIGLPMFPDLGIPQTQYRAALNLEQVLFNGGSTSARRELTKVESAAELQSVEVDWQRVKTMVVNLYFAIAMQDRSAEILDASARLLGAKLDQLQAMVNAGTLLESEMLRVKAQLYELQKQQSQVEYQKQASLKSLGILTGKELGTAARVEIPELGDMQAPKLDQLPQLQQISLQKQRIEASQKVASTALIPRLSAFGTGGVAQPNPYNFFNTEFGVYYMVGAKIQWNVFDWNTTRRTNANLGLRKEMLEAEAEQLRRSQQIKLADHQANINQLEETVEKDEEIAEMRAKIRQTASSQLDQGALTSADYLETVMDEQKALLTKELNAIRLTKAREEYAIESGNF